MTHSLVLVGNAGDGTVSTYRLAGDALTHLATNPVGRGCSTFAVDPERDLVHVATKDGPSIVTCRLSRTSGTLTPVGTMTASGNASYLELAHGGTVLLVAYYHEGLGEARPVVDGVVGKAVGRVASANMHCVVATRDSRHAYFVSLGDDLVAACEVGPDGSLTLLGDTAAPEGSGPRHLVLDAAEANAYVVTEFSGEIVRFRRDPATGALTAAGATAVVDPGFGLAHSRYGADPRAEHLIWGADLHLSADGRTVWSTERTESVLTTSPIDGDGAVGAPVAHLATEPQPRGFGVSPDGRHLVVTGERSRSLTLYGIGDDGIPVALGRADTGAGANWVRFVSLG